MFTVFTDTDTDVTLSEVRDYGWKLISMPYSAGGNTVYPYEDWDTFDAKLFYDSLRSGTLPTTSAISPERYRQYFEPEFAAGRDILYVHFSAAMTMTFDNMAVAVKELEAAYPQRHFYTVDTKGITLGSINIVREIADLCKKGADIPEILAWADKEVNHFAAYFFADDLRFFKASGRVSGLSATMGTLLGVRPIIHMNAEGKMVSIGKERGREKALQHLLDTVVELGDDIGSHRIILGHSDAEGLVNQFEQMLRQRFPQELHIERVVVNPTAGSHCGPDSMGISFHAIHR